MVKIKPSTGRKKIEIKRINKEAARDVCFSKRRRGLFNKAGELSLLCEAKIATVMFSRARKGFSFGHPSMDDVANLLDSMSMGIADNPSLGGGSHGSGEVQKLKLEHVELQKSLENEKETKENKEKQMMEKETLEKEMGGHLMQSVNSEANLLGLDEVEELHYKLSVVRDDISERNYQISLAQGASKMDNLEDDFWF